MFLVAEKITGPAIRMPDGRVLTNGATHGGIMQSLSDAEWEDADEGDHGFVTDSGRFVDREEAFRIANEAKQIEIDETSSEWIGPALDSWDLPYPVAGRVKQVGEDFIPPSEDEMHADDRAETKTAMPLIDQMPAGQCFHNAFLYALEHNIRDGKIVHGLVTNAWGDRFLHGWIERGNELIDPTAGVITDKAGYYKRMNVEVQASYSVDEAIAKCFQHAHSGPWHEAKKKGADMSFDNGDRIVDVSTGKVWEVAEVSWEGLHVQDEDTTPGVVLWADLRVGRYKKAEPNELEGWVYRGPQEGAFLKGASIGEWIVDEGELETLAEQKGLTIERTIEGIQVFDETGQTDFNNVYKTAEEALEDVRRFGSRRLGTQVVLENEDGSVEWEGSLDDFIRDNRQLGEEGWDPGMDPELEADIRTVLPQTGSYLFGGGAAPLMRLRLASRAHAEAARIASMDGWDKNGKPLHVGDTVTYTDDAGRIYQGAKISDRSEIGGWIMVAHPDFKEGLLLVPFGSLQIEGAPRREGRTRQAAEVGTKIIYRDDLEMGAYDKVHEITGERWNGGTFMGFETVDNRGTEGFLPSLNPGWIELDPGNLSADGWSFQPQRFASEFHAYDAVGDATGMMAYMEDGREFPSGLSEDRAITTPDPEQIDRPLTPDIRAGVRVAGTDPGHAVPANMVDPDSLGFSWDEHAIDGTNADEFYATADRLSASSVMASIARYSYLLPVEAIAKFQNMLNMGYDPGMVLARFEEELPQLKNLH